MVLVGGIAPGDGWSRLQLDEWVSGDIRRVGQGRAGWNGILEREKGLSP